MGDEFEDSASERAKTITKSSSENSEDVMAIAISMRFESNSELLAGFYDAIEKKIIK